MTTMTFIVLDAHCGSCRADIERAIGALPGVSMATVDLRTTTLVVEGDAQELDRDAITDALREAGFPARSVLLDADSNGPSEPV